MFDLGWTEFIVVAVVAILVVGPKELPGMLRTIGKSIGSMRRMAGDFQRQMNDALKEADLDGIKTGIDSVNSINPMSQMKKALNPVKQAAEDVQRDINKGLLKAGEGGEPDAPAGDAAIAKVSSAKTDAAASKAAAKPKPARKPRAAAKPATAKAAATKAAAAKAATAKAATTKATATKAATAKAASSKATTAKPAAKKTAARMPAAKKTETKAATKSAAAKKDSDA